MRVAGGADPARPARPHWRWLGVVAILSITLSGCGAGGGSPTAGRSTDPDMQEGGTQGGAMMMEVLDRTEWQGMRVELATSEPTTFTVFQGQDTREVTPTAEDSLHVMAVLADQETGERIPYANVWLSITDQEGEVVFDERMWPMLSRGMGTHYGINVPFPEAGTYDASVQIGPPQAARHPEYSDRWLEAFTFDTTIEWEGG